ncbi:MAG: hypothetical protein ACSHW9_03295 [Salinibacterium amurskyense]
MADDGAGPASPSAIRSILKLPDIGGASILMQEDPYSEPLVQSISFTGGPYLVSGGSGEHAIADLENFIDAAFREPWMPDDLRVPTRQLIRALLTVSDIVLKRAGLKRGTAPEGSAQSPVEVPGANRLRELSDAAFISNDVLAAHGDWLRTVIDTFAFDPCQLIDPCDDDYTDDRLYAKPFLRLSNGFRVVLPLDLSITIRFHLLRFAFQEGQLESLGVHWRDAALVRLRRLLPTNAQLVELERAVRFDRYIAQIDERLDLHVVVATDPLVDWRPEMWGTHDTRAALAGIADLIAPTTRATYSSAEEILHLVITDSPGRGAFWGVPDVAGAGAVLIARSDDLEVMLHQEPDGLLGLFLFAQARARRSGSALSTDILDEFDTYASHDKSFYCSDERSPIFTIFPTGGGLRPRMKFHSETDRHGVVLPLPNAPIVQVQRRFEQDLPEVFVTLPYSSDIGWVVESEDQILFISFDLQGANFIGAEMDLMDCVAYWVRECMVKTGAKASSKSTNLVLSLSDPEHWRRAAEPTTTEHAVEMVANGNHYRLEFTATFVMKLQESSNIAERDLAAVLLSDLFDVTGDELIAAVDRVAPLGAKRMINLFIQDQSPDMLSESLPQALTGHDQIDAQVLDELGEWLRSATGGAFPTGSLAGDERVKVLNLAVSRLFSRLEDEIKVCDKEVLLSFLIGQNEALLHSARLSTKMLKSRLACFGEQSHTVAELVADRKELTTAHRANRFLIEYVAAQPPAGQRKVAVLDYYRILSLGKEIIERATASDFLRYGLADFKVSILESGRLGVSREEPVSIAMEAYATSSGFRSVRDALDEQPFDNGEQIDSSNFIARSELPMHAEFGFTLTELREVCGGLLDLATADHVTRIDRAAVITRVASSRSLAEDTVSAVISRISLSQRPSFLSIGPDAWPWRFNRDMSFIPRPVVLQGDELVFGYRSVYRLGIHWADSLLSGRLQSRAKTIAMQQFISKARRQVNDNFALSVATRLDRLGFVTQISVKKVGGQRIANSGGEDLGDIDILAVHSKSRSIVAVEAKDFEVARTPAEISNEVEKLFSGNKHKKSTVELHSRRVLWLKQHLETVIASLELVGAASAWRVVGVIVTSDPLITPLVRSSPIAVVPFADLDLDSLNLQDSSRHRSKASRSRNGRRGTRPATR